MRRMFVSILILFGLSTSNALLGQDTPSVDQTPDALSQVPVPPPMGWTTWSHYTHNFTSQNVLDNAHALVSTGLAAKGYKFVNIDGGWEASERDAQGSLQPDPVNFPNGMLPVAQQIHGLGLKFGMYTSAGATTCAGKPGSGRTAQDSQTHFAADTALFNSWGFDFLKLDACYVYIAPGQTPEDAFHQAFAEEYQALQSLHRPVLFSESAPAYFPDTPQWYDILSWVANYGQLWRTGLDLGHYDPSHPTLDQFPTVLWNYTYNLPLGRFQSPGKWDDPDFVIAGDPELTIPESRTQFALWAMMSAPLILGADLTQLSPNALAILGNSRVIAVDQDPLGKMATLLERNASTDVLVKPLADGYAVAVPNRGDTPQQLTISATDLGFSAQCSFALQDLWSGSTTPSAHQISAQIASHDTGIWKLSPSAQCGTRSRSGAIIMTVPSQKQKLNTYAQCLSSSGQVEVCTAGRDQAWTVSPLGQLIDQNGLCLEDFNGQIVQAQCMPNWWREQWTYTQAGNLINRVDHRCLSAAVTNGLPSTLEIEACGYNLANQIWSLPN